MLRRHEEDNYRLNNQNRFARDADLLHARSADFQNAEKRAHQDNAERLIPHDHRHQHSVPEKSVGNRIRESLVQSEHFKHSNHAADRAGNDHAPQHEFL